MTRFSPNGVRIGYAPQQQQKPGQQLMGMYGLWRSLSPETRDWLTSKLFSDELDYSNPDATNEQTETANKQIDMMSNGIDTALMEHMQSNPIQTVMNPYDKIQQSQVRNAIGLARDINHRDEIENARRMALGEPLKENLWDPDTIYTNSSEIMMDVAPYDFWRRDRFEQPKNYLDENQLDVLWNLRRAQEKAEEKKKTEENTPYKDWSDKEAAAFDKALQEKGF